VIPATRTVSWTPVAFLEISGAARLELAVRRYRFSDFTLSTRKRLLIRNGQHLPLIPRYLDLLIFLVERRRDAVHRREIFDRVWSDVIVSDSALSQAIRTLRRTLGDDPREPRFIRTVSRHGYQFTCPDVIEEPDEDVQVSAGLSAEAGTAKADARIAHPDLTRQKVGASLTALMTGATRACAGAALAGAAAGIAGGLLLILAPDNAAPPAIVPVLVLVGAGAGAVGGLGVGAGLAFAESSSRLRNVLGLTIGAAAGGAAMGMAVQWLMRWSLAAVVGLNLPIGGAFEALVIGAATGLGYAIARRHTGTPLTRSAPGPSPRSPIQRAALVAAFCAAAALALAWAGRPLVGGTLHVIAREARGSQISLTPLGRLIGEPEFGPVSQALIAAWEGGIFGFGVGIALLRRRSHADLTDSSSAAQDLPAV
jgi:DNA-binding winged helix-turn-helix (wHTH) protein